jgi:hypothetical protein
VLFFNLQLGFNIFWQKNISAKAVCNMLVKVTEGVTFINIFCTIGTQKMFAKLTKGVNFSSTLHGQIFGMNIVFAAFFLVTCT